LDSTTTEEANSDFINWVKQRSRWYKGYLQTWLVHMRHPVELWRQLGPGGFLRVNLLLGAVPVVALINPTFWLLTGLWFLAKPGFLEAWLPPAVYYASLFSMIAGNFLALYLGLIAVRATRHPRLVWAALASPIYWAMMSVAALRAVLQLVVDPYFWEKSVHGLDRRLDAKEAPLGAGS
jgi:cellulose synthase/poly-beta-1,6-N-acetylglucosamine synthase-like glycosyltransferase